jgi:hypothetical protein
MARLEGRLLDLHAQAERPQVIFSFAEAVLDLHALAIKPHHLTSITGIKDRNQTHAGRCGLCQPINPSVKSFFRKNCP